MPSPSFSPEQLDTEYSPSSTAPGWRSVLAEYRDRSDAAKETLRCELNVRYGDRPGERLHHFWPRRPGSPLLVFVHGGHWQDLSIDDSCFAAPDLVGQGAGLLAVGYRLAPAGTLEEMVASVARALEWVVGHAADLGGTPERVHAAGSSAGAHLVAMALGAAPAAADVRLAGVALLSGVYDLELLRRTYVNDALGLTEEAAYRNSPVHFLPIRADEVLVARGGTETGEYGRQHDLLVGAGRQPGVRSLVARDRNHFDLPLGLGDPGDELGRAVLRQLRLEPSA